MSSSFVEQPSAPVPSPVSVPEAGAHPLDNPAWAALNGAHAGLAIGSGGALRYPADVSPFFGLPGEPDADAWAGAAELAGPGGTVLLAGNPAAPPANWTIDMDLPGVQLTGEQVPGAADPEAVRLGEADVPEMLDLVSRTKPGPFEQRTVLLGGYLGIRRGGALVAMAGQRMRPEGWTEISAVCTDPDHRGHGYARRLVGAVAADIRARGDLPFLHAAAENETAVGLYLAMGFRLRRTLSFRALHVN